MLYGSHINIPVVVLEFWVLTNDGAAQALYVGASKTVTNGPLPSDYKGQSIVLVPPQPHTDKSIQWPFVLFIG